MRERLLAGFIREGCLTVLTTGGRKLSFGTPDPGERGLPEIVIRLPDRASLLRVALHPTVRFGDAHMNGNLVLEHGSLAENFELCWRNLRHRRASSQRSGRGPLRRAFRALARRIQRHNPVAAARRNAAHHYDLSETLFRLFLDSDLNHSCAYFAAPDLSLEDAQRAKQRHIGAKLLLAPGQRVLDIGCGWGSLALALSQMADITVDGITLSAEQHARARARAAAAGLSSRVRFALADYREIEGSFDRIVSVGMFERVGSPYYRTFFARIRRLPAPDGIALIHPIGRIDSPGLTDPWTRK